MFDRIAGFYDVMNSAMTAGMHHRWRARAVDSAALGPGDAALDVCCGTGDLTLELARRVGPTGRVVGSDFAERMLDLARDKPVPAERRSRSSSGPMRSRSPTTTRASTPSPSASGFATSPISTAASPRWTGC